MQIEITHKFRKQVNRLTDKKLKNKIHKLIVEIAKAHNLSEIKNLKKLKGHQSFYRIRMGDYRIGLQVAGKTIVLAAIDHRSDNYRSFP